MELLERLKQEKKSYAEMVEWCTHSLVLANAYVETLESERNIFLGECVKSGEISYYYNEEGDEISYSKYCELSDNGEDVSETYKDVYTFYIIDEEGAERFAEYTNEVIYYIKEDDVYILGVAHYGTPWGSVPANWKDEQ